VHGWVGIFAKRLWSPDYPWAPTPEQRQQAVLHRSDDLDAKVEEGRWIASRIPDARFVELPGADHLPWVGDQDAVLDEVEEFLRGVPGEWRLFAVVGA
jgi:pimeloyl-ACP methyl ester carboxylesterase